MMKTHCKHGHEYTAENVYINPTSKARCCKTCIQKTRDEWQKANLERYKAITAKARRKWRANNKAYWRAHALKRHHNLTQEQYEALLEKQNGVCAICKLPPAECLTNSGVLHVDHCHSSGKIRGLLCLTCNTGIGSLKDNPALLRFAAEYLERQ